MLITSLCCTCQKERILTSDLYHFRCSWLWAAVNLMSNWLWQGSNVITHGTRSPEVVWASGIQLCHQGLEFFLFLPSEALKLAKIEKKEIASSQAYTVEFILRHAPLVVVEQLQVGIYTYLAHLQLCLSSEREALHGFLLRLGKLPSHAPQASLSRHVFGPN